MESGRQEQDPVHLAAPEQPNASPGAHATAQKQPTQKTGDPTANFQNRLQHLQTYFQVNSESIITQIRENGTRLQELEKKIGELVNDTGRPLSSFTSLEKGSQTPVQEFRET